MRVFAAVLRLVAVLFLLTAAAIAGDGIRVLRTQPSPSATPSEPSLAAGAAPATSTATTNCDQLARIALSLAPALAIADAGGGMQRITSAEGGYSFLVPMTWRAKDTFAVQPMFGQVYLTSYDPKTAPTPDPERWMLPPEVGISFIVQVWRNPDGLSLDRYASLVRIGPDQMSTDAGTFTIIGGQQAYHFTIHDEHRFQPVDRPPVVTRQIRVIWLIQSPRPDWVVVAYATPGESSLLATVERAVAGMTITTPVASRRPVTLQRDAILSSWLLDKSGATIAGRRVEAKLMTYAEANAALNGGGGGLLRIDHDPDDLYWVVAVSGGDLPMGRRGRLSSSGTPPPTAWILYDTAATGGDIAGTGTRYAVQGTWPPSFDALPDRCY
jgi:hypothetical protein